MKKIVQVVIARSFRRPQLHLTRRGNLLLSLFIILNSLFIIPKVYAAPGIDCWQTYMNHEYQICSNQDTKCILACPSKAGPVLNACFAQCSGADRLCTDRVKTSYDACVKAQKKPENKQLEPTGAPAPTTSESSTDGVPSCCSDPMNSPRARRFNRWQDCAYKQPPTKTRADLNKPDPCKPILDAPESDFICTKISECVPESIGTPNPTTSPADLQNNQNDNQSEKPSVGVSSRDFRALAKANAEFQQAQADLEKVKETKDPRWEDNKDFIPAENEPVESGLDQIKENLDKTKDGASVWLDIKELYDYSKNGKLGPYGGVSLTTDVANGVIKFTELKAKGVSTDAATAKTIIDTVGTASLNIFPPAKIADMVATMPDRVLHVMGFSEKSLPRKVTGFLKGNSPSAFIELTTDAMVTTGNWENMGGILAQAIENVQSAHGFGEKVQETVNLVGTFVGAVPVGIALEFKDKVSITFLVGEKVIGFVSSWFTYPN